MKIEKYGNSLIKYITKVVLNLIGLKVHRPSRVAQMPSVSLDSIGYEESDESRPYSNSETELNRSISATFILNSLKKAVTGKPAKKSISSYHASLYSPTTTSVSSTLADSEDSL